MLKRGHKAEKYLFQENDLNNETLKDTNNNSNNTNNTNNTNNNNNNDSSNDKKTTRNKNGDANADAPILNNNNTNNNNNNNNNNVQTSLSVRFVTKIEDPSMHVDDAWYTLPSTLQPKSLSEVINHLLVTQQQQQQQEKEKEENNNESIENQKIKTSAIAFDFLIHDVLLRSPIAVHLQKHRISSEKNIVIEYMEKTTEPSEESGHQHPDWVSCVDVLGRGSSRLQIPSNKGGDGNNYLFVTGCYDGVIRVWNVASVASPSTTKTQKNKSNNEQLCTSYRGHLSPIKGVTNLYHWNGSHFFATACKNGAVKVFEMTSKDKSYGSNSAQIHELHCNNFEHRASVESISSPNQSKVFATGSVDTHVKLWRVQDESNETSSQYKEEGEETYDMHNTETEVTEDNLRPSKRVKLMSTNELRETLNEQELPANESNTELEKRASKRMKSIGTLRGHKEMVNCLHWVNPYALYSGSWDQTIRLWDATKEIDVYTWQTSSAVTSLQYWSSQNVLISSHSNQKICIWDPRVDDSTAETMLSKSSRHTYRSHRLPITDIKCSEKESRPLFISSSFDGTIKFWDLRSNEPLYKLNRHSDKVLCMEWINDTIVSGGADSHLYSYNWKVSG